MEPLGGGTSQEEVHHWGQTLRLDSLSPLFFFFSASCVLGTYLEPDFGVCGYTNAFMLW